HPRTGKSSPFMGRWLFPTQWGSTAACGGDGAAPEGLELACSGARLVGLEGRISPPRPLHLPQRLLARAAPPAGQGGAGPVRPGLGRAGHAGLVLDLAAS